MAVDLAPPAPPVQTASPVLKRPMLVGADSKASPVRALQQALQPQLPQSGLLQLPASLPEGLVDIAVAPEPVRSATPPQLQPVVGA